jgi:hypothetical protein
MEVWALEAYGASNTLQELLTIKSDDIDGRNDMYESILIRKEIEKPKPSIPESFLTLIRELNALGLDFSSRKINAGLMTSYKGKVKKAKEEPEVEEERDLFKQVELRLKLRALLARKKSEQFTIEEEVHSEEEKKKQNQRKEDYRKVLENFRKIQDEISNRKGDYYSQSRNFFYYSMDNHAPLEEYQIMCNDYIAGYDRTLKIDLKSPPFLTALTTKVLCGRA